MPRTNRPKLINNWGGHMLNPPKSCEHKRLGEEGLCYWVDLVICSYQCEKKYKCRRYKKWKAMTYEEQHEYLRVKGVKYFHKNGRVK